VNTVLENLFLRRPKIEYVSPPVCPIIFSSSGVAFIDQTFDDGGFCPMIKLLSNFLNFAQPPDGLAYNVYYSTQESGQPFQLVVDGLLPNTVVVFTPGVYWVTVNTASGESGPFPPITASGTMYFRMPLPQASGIISYNLYKDGVKLIAGFTGTVVESSAQGWYQATKITIDGESPLTGCIPVLLSGTVPVPPPPPPPPPPGPPWTTFIYGNPVCLGCIGVEVSGVPNCFGGFSPPGAGFSLHTEMIGGNPAFEFVENQSGYVTGYYQGPPAHCQLTLVASVGGGQPINVNNIIVVVYNGSTNIFSLSGSAAYTTGTYTFNVPNSPTLTQINVEIQGYAVATQSLQMAGSIVNIP
jgi:hypothetical protein